MKTYYIKVANHRKEWTTDELRVIEDEFYKGPGYVKRAAARLGRKSTAVQVAKTIHLKHLKHKKEDMLNEECINYIITSVALSPLSTEDQAMRKAACIFKIQLTTVRSIIAKAKRGEYDN